MESGVVCVHHTGITRMRLWFADNWDTQLQVRMMECALVFPVTLINIDLYCVLNKLRPNELYCVVFFNEA